MRRQTRIVYLEVPSNVVEVDAVESLSSHGAGWEPDCARGATTLDYSILLRGVNGKGRTKDSVDRKSTCN